MAASDKESSKVKWPFVFWSINEHGHNRFETKDINKKKEYM